MTILQRLDSRITLEPEERMLLESVQVLAREQIGPRAEHFDRTADFPGRTSRPSTSSG
jgi:hypothetical protein